MRVIDPSFLEKWSPVKSLTSSANGIPGHSSSRSCKLAHVCTCPLYHWYEYLQDTGSVHRDESVLLQKFGGRPQENVLE